MLRQAALLTIFFCLISGTTFAKSNLTPGQNIHSTPPDVVVGAMSNKLVRGVTNVLTGWLEIPKQIGSTFKNEGVVKGIFVGPLKGIGMTFVRTGAGTLEAATSFLPYPGFYDPYFYPEYVWQRE